MHFSSSDETTALGSALDRAIDKIDETPAAQVASMIRDRDVSIAKILQMSGPEQIIGGSIDRVIDAAVAPLFDSVFTPDLWGATFGTLSVGLPHVHIFPVPLPPPPPLPTAGPLSLGLCASVRIHGLPIGRSGDLGIVLCPSLDPVFKVTTGSTKVFVGGRRAARVADATIHGAVSVETPQLKPGTFALPLFHVARKSFGRYLESRPAREAGERRARTLEWSANARQARAAGAREEGGSFALELEAANANASAEGAAAAAAGQAEGMANAAAQAISDATAAVFGALAKLQPAATPSRGRLLPLTNFSVTFGGFPFKGVSIGGRVTKLGKRVGKGLGGRAASKLGPRIPQGLRDGWAGAKLKLRAAGAPWRARIREAVPLPLRMLSGHPVDVVTGAVLTDAVDAHLRGRWTLPVRRNYSSSWSERPGPLGFGWSLSIDLAIWLEPGLLVHRAPDGRELFFDLPHDLDPDDRGALSRLVLIDPCNGLRITGEADGAWTISIGDDGVAYSPDGIRRIELAPIAEDPEAPHRRGIARARRLYGPEGAVIELDYDRRGRLIAARQGPRTLGLLWHEHAPRIVGLTLPDPGSGPEARARTGDREPPPASLGQRLHRRYAYDDAGDLTTVTDCLGHRQEITYDDHRLVRETFADGRSFVFSYDGPGAQALCTATRGDHGVFSRTFSYEPEARRTEIVDGEGQRTVVQADGRGRVVTVTDPEGGTTTLAYDDHDRRVLERDALGRGTHYAFDELGRRRSVRLADGATWSFDHTIDGRRASVTDGEGGSWRWRYDERGRVVASTDPLGVPLRYEFDDRAGTAQVFAESGLREDGATSVNTVETLEFSAAGDLLRRRRPDGSDWSYSYDRRGRCVEIIDPLGHRQRYIYDAMDRLIVRIGADGERVELRRDPVGRPLRVVSPGYDIAMTYDPCGRVASVTGDPRFPDGLTCRYDSEARLLALTHGDREHTFERDPLGAVIGEVNIDGQSRRYRRDACGRVRELLQPDGEWTRYAYDERDRIVAIDYPDDSHERFTYSPRGALVRALRDEPRPATPSVAGAPADELQGASSGDPSPPLRRSLPRPSIPPLPPIPASRISLDRPFEGSFGRGEPPFDPLAELPPSPAEDRRRHIVELERDPIGRVVGEIVRVDGDDDDGDDNGDRGIADAIADETAPRRIAIERDLLGRTKRLRADTGPVLTCSFAALTDRSPSALTIHSGRQTWPFLTGRDRRGHGLRRRLPGGVDELVERDARGRPTLQTIRASTGALAPLLPGESTLLCRCRYQWGADGRARTILESPTANASPQSPPPQSPPPQSPPPQGPPRSSLTHPQAVDANGRTTLRHHAGAELRLSWDAAGRLRRVDRDGAAPVRFDYDALGRRIRKTVGARVTTWLWDGDRPLVEEIREHRSLVTRRAWIFDPDPQRLFSPIAVIVDEQLYSVHCDQLGTPLLATDTAGEVVWRRPSPEDRSSPPPDGLATPSSPIRGHSPATGTSPSLLTGTEAPLRRFTLDLPFGYPGHYYDHETGLFYSRHRYYDPERGRFISPDPSGLRGGLDPTAYVDDPTTMIDPLGLRGYSVTSTLDPAPAPAQVADEPPSGSAHQGPLTPDPTAGAASPYTPPVPPAPSPSGARPPTFASRIHKGWRKLSVTC